MLLEILFLPEEVENRTMLRQYSFLNLDIYHEYRFDAIQIHLTPLSYVS